MRIVSVSEDLRIEKRIAITPEIAKKYIGLGFDVTLSENYGVHLGIEDNEYLNLGVKISKNEKEIINSGNIIVQLTLPSDEMILSLKKDQILIGVLNLHDNKAKKDNILKTDASFFSLELLPRITRAQSMDILSSQANLAGYKGVIESFAHY